MKTLLALLSLLLAAPSAAQSQRPADKDGIYYGINFRAAAPIDWYGEPMFLLWSLPSDANDDDPVWIVTVDFQEETVIGIRVGIELVGFAAYDPRPCAIGTTAVLSTAGGIFYDDSFGYVQKPCGTTLYATIGGSGMGYNFPAHPPLLQASDCPQCCAPWEGSKYVISYFSDPPYFTNHVSRCGDGLQPAMGFILGRLVLL